MKSIEAIIEISRETLYLLRRGPIFVPAILFSLLLITFGSLASSWGVSEFRKIFFDISGFGFHILGNTIAIIWSIKIVSIAKLDGSLEIQLASPVSRSSWYIGRSLGIFISLLIMGALMLLITQATMLLTGFEYFRLHEFTALFLQIIGWMVVASIALFFSTFCGLVTGLFSAFSLWISGLLTELLAFTLKEDLQALKAFFDMASKVWNLQTFNRTPSFLLEQSSYLLWGALYALFLIMFFTVAGIMTFSRSFD